VEDDKRDESRGARQALISSKGRRPNRRRPFARYRRAELSENDLIDWAEALQGREDLRLEPHDDGRIKDALFSVSTPELFGELPDVVSALESGG
jgi:hypothetical protein